MENVLDVVQFVYNEYLRETGDHIVGKKDIMIKSNQCISKKVR